MVDYFLNQPFLFTLPYMSRMNIELVWSLATETTHFFTSTPSFR